ncbi:DUF1634 domain-containing protein [Mucilaginibacter lacusdianchii]|uniref:DUF1634 domain-containing protein n=1 Tax=Mucilaginibacter lacusdianchii TaxID=2684211 RepID=UPI00131DEBB6|nr:DUF1634 domain-containing protein [Mucilaginibacter sp. JXJ CY 39]
MAERRTFKDTDMQQVLGWVLRIGVSLSMLVVCMGGVLYLYRHGHATVSYQKFTGIPHFVHSASGIWNGIFAGRGRAIIQAGIILLIATPVIRVVFSAVGFVIEKDWLYTGISLLVLLVIIISALTGHGG